MKKLLALVLIFCAAPLASCSIVMMQISVDGIVDPPDSNVFVRPSETATIDLHGFVASSEGEAITGLMFVQGPGIITGGSVLQGDGTITEIDIYEDPSAWGPSLEEVLAENGYSGVTNPALYIELYDSTIPFTDMDGILVDYIQFHCEGPGDSVITFLNTETFEPYDVQVIHQGIPEPVSAVMFGLCGIILSLRHKNKRQ